MSDKPDVHLLPVDDDVLERLLAAAVADADPGEVMPPVAGPAGWTDQRRDAFRSFHRDRRDGLAGSLSETTIANTAARGALRHSGASISTETGSGRVHAEIHLT